MKSFFEVLGRFLTSMRTWTVNLLTLATVLYLVFIVVAVVRQMPERVDPAGRVLIIAPKGNIVDQAVYPAELKFPFNLPESAPMQTRDLIRVIRAAGADESLAGVLIDFSKASFAGPSTALRIAGELADLKAANKPLLAFSETLSTGSYLLASQADEVYVHPSGGVAVSGLGGYRNYLRELMAKLKINIHNYSQGDYKSAVEGFTRSDMSEADRRQRVELLDPIWSSFKETMASGRGIDADIFQELADNHLGTFFQDAAYDNLAFARDKGIIDGTRSFPQFRAQMIDRFGRDEEDEERVTYPHIGYEAYLAQLEAEEVSEDAVAVVFVQGAIQSGPQGPGVAGSDDIARLIRLAYEQEDTRALVLRVSSPGGSIMASDLIRDELVAAKNQGIPVYVSMGDVAASGGVWVSTPADRIYAEAATITGSIGVAVLIPTLENLLAYIGVNPDGVTTSEYAGWTPYLPVDEKLDGILSRWAGSAYEQFVSNVATDRGRDSEYVRSIAGGRVWLAPKALELGLIDEIGGMEVAVAAAAESAGVSDYRVDYMVDEPSPAVRFLQRFSGSLGISLDSDLKLFGRTLSAWLEIVGDLQEPHATVVCANCEVELR